MDRLDNVGGTDPADARGGTEQPQRVLHDVKSKSWHEFDRQRLPRATRQSAGTNSYPSREEDVKLIMTALECHGGRLIECHVDRGHD